MRGFLNTPDAQPRSWLFVGVVVLWLTQINHAVAPLAWVAAFPWLRYLRITHGWRSRLGFGVALLLAWTLAVFKIASEPKFFLMAPLYSLPLTLAQLPVYLAWDTFRRRISPAHATAFFALALAAEEAALYTFTPLGSWGATAYTQLGNLPLLQFASWAGIAGVGAVVNFVGAALESATSLPRQPKHSRLAAVALLSAAVVHVYGAARMWRAETEPTRLLSVAMVGTDSDVRGLPLPTREQTRAWDATLHERTRVAAAAGAQLVVWTEAATLVWPDDEIVWVESLRRLAQETHTDMVAGYVLPISSEPFRYRNEYRIALRDGTVLPPYAKFYPVPGEPAVKGNVVSQFVQRPWGLLAGAICYDYDFPPLARARHAAGIVAVPASDWRGIDPVHGEMAAVRGIESGHSIVRSTRWGLSIASDAYGRVRAARSAFETGSPVTLALVPYLPVPTVYARLGDVPLWAGFVVVVALVWRTKWAATRTPDD